MINYFLKKKKLMIFQELLEKIEIVISMDLCKLYLAWAFWNLYDLLGFKERNVELKGQEVAADELENATYFKIEYQKKLN